MVLPVNTLMVLPVNTLMVLGSFEMYPVGFSWPVVLKANNNEAHKLVSGGSSKEFKSGLLTCCQPS